MTKIIADIEAEQALLGKLLLDNDAIDAVADILRVSHFCDSLHQLLYKTILAGVRLGRTVTPRSLASTLKNNALLKTVDDKYLATITTLWLPGMSIRSLAEIVRDHALRRGIAEVASDLSTAAASPPPDQKTESIIDLAEEALHQLVGDEDAKKIEPIAEVVSRAIIGAERAWREPAAAGCVTNMPSIDAAIAPLVPGDLIVLGGATSMGKTALAQQISLEVARQGRRVLAFSMEMRAEEYVNRHIAQAAQVPANRIESGRISDQEMAKIAATEHLFREIPLFIDASPALSVGQIRSRIRRHIRRGGVDLVMVDHLRFVKPDDPRALERDQLQQVTRDLKAVAKECNIPVLLISHVNRESHNRENKRPILSDLFGASAIEQNADTVLFVHRDEYWLSRSKPSSSDAEAHAEWAEKFYKVKGQADIIVAKRRRGPCTDSRLRFNAELTLFIDPQVSDNTAQSPLI